MSDSLSGLATSLTLSCVTFVIFIWSPLQLLCKINTLKYVDYVVFSFASFIPVYLTPLKRGGS